MLDYRPTLISELEKIGIPVYYELICDITADKQLYVPAALLDYKFSLLHEKGELVSPMYIRKTKFLKDDLGDYDDANHFEYE